jgi:hypothetical protein
MAVVAILTLIAAWLVVPEFREWSGLDKPRVEIQLTSISGIVVDRDTNRGIGQAAITLIGRAEQYVTEDSGNFRIDLPSGPAKRLRLHVTKGGFQPLDMSVEPPVENLYLQLHKE